MKMLMMMAWGVAMALLVATPAAAGGRLMQADKGEVAYAAQKCSICYSLDPTTWATCSSPDVSAATTTTTRRAMAA